MIDKKRVSNNRLKTKQKQKNKTHTFQFVKKHKNTKSFVTNAMTFAQKCRNE